MARNINIGKVALKFCGLWDNITAYNAFDCVNNNNNSSFVALKDVPIGIDLYNEEYWLRQTNFDDVADAEAARVEEFETKIMQIDSDVESAEEFKNQAEQAVIDAEEILQDVTTEGNTQVQAVNTAGAEQIGLATAQADRAEGEADKSTSQASKSESYAVGGTGTRPGEDTDNSKHYSGISLQAMTDLLAMLGSDIATLTDGKLTPSQIPPLSINDVFEVETEEDMLALTAERGDVALILSDGIVEDSYILAADDPTLQDNWKKLGISYVANAGHASTADNAVNADKINNKRMVAMTQSQYDNAVLDDNTFYIVTPDEV